MTNNRLTLESSHHAALKSILSLPPDERSPEIIWDITLKNQPFVEYLVRLMAKKNKNLADDLLQEGLVAIYKFIAGFQGNSSPDNVKGYLCQSVRNACVAYLFSLDVIPIKTATRFKVRDKSDHSPSVDAARRTLAMSRDVTAEPVFDGSDSLEKSLAELFNGIASLTPKEQVIVNNYYGLGTKKIRPAQISELMGITLHQVKYHRVKAFTRLQSLMRAS